MKVVGGHVHSSRVKSPAARLLMTALQLVTHTVGQVIPGYPGGIFIAVYFMLEFAFLDTSQCTFFAREIS